MYIYLYDGAHWVLTIFQNGFYNCLRVDIGRRRLIEEKTACGN